MINNSGNEEVNRLDITCLTASEIDNWLKISYQCMYLMRMPRLGPNGHISAYDV